MSQVQVNGLFPVPFMRVRGVLDQASIAALIAAGRRMAREANAKSDHLSHTEIVAPESSPCLRELDARVVPRLVDFGSLLFGENLDWCIKEMWMNELEHGGRQAIHSHANSFISGIIYLTESHPSARTIFYRSLGGAEFTFKNDNPNAAIGPFNGSRWVLPEIVAGDMVLFPSYLLHEVPPNEGTTRISLSFNAIPDHLTSWGYRIRFTR
jgi:uncharacterized protein (TIGR02466 family)